MEDKQVFVSSYPDGDLNGLMRESFRYIGLDATVQDQSSVFIKPNLTYPEFKPGVTTRVEFVRSLIETLHEANPKLSIVVGEGEGGYNSFSMTKALRTMGYVDLENEYTRVVNLSDVPKREVSLDTPKGPYSIALPELFFTGIDFSISCPVPKVHAMTRVSLSYKNLWGCLPDTMRLKNHYMFDYIISRVAEILKFRYAFLDGMYGLTRSGPMVGDAVEPGWFVASNSLGAFDTVVSEMMGFEYHTVGHLKAADVYGYIPKADEMKITGDPAALAQRFVLKRTFWSYPALFAFHSKRLTRFFYFSKWAKLLHDIMYTFRKRPIS